MKKQKPHQNRAHNQTNKYLHSGASGGCWQLPRNLNDFWQLNRTFTLLAVRASGARRLSHPEHVADPPLVEPFQEYILQGLFTPWPACLLNGLAGSSSACGRTAPLRSAPHRAAGTLTLPLLLSTCSSAQCGMAPFQYFARCVLFMLCLLRICSVRQPAPIVGIALNFLPPLLAPL